MNGVLVVDKPEGPTSHDVVAMLRKRVRPSRTGHTGTLDPLATGVLPVCVGAATRLTRYLSRGPKVYSGEMALGASTDTYDSGGTVLSSRPVEGMNLDRLNKATGLLTGALMQAPPLWSAKKIEGRRSYDLARAGKARALAPCAVHVESFRITALRGDTAEFRVDCSGGTYVRSLVNDLGESLGCGAHLTALRRLRSGPFTIEQSSTLEALMGRETALREALIPMEDLDLGMTTARLSPAGVEAALNGRIVPGGEMELESRSDELPVRMLDPGGKLVGVAEPAQAGGLQPRVILAGSAAGKP